jgi:hypothetical protein
LSGRQQPRGGKAEPLAQPPDASVCRNFETLRRASNPFPQLFTVKQLFSPQTVLAGAPPHDEVSIG